MDLVFEAVKSFLFEKEAAVIHSIARAAAGIVLAALVIGIFSKLLPLFFKAITRVIIEFITNINRCREGALTIKEYTEITERIERGGKVKWYEKRGYEALKKQEEEAEEAIKNHGQILNNPDFKGQSFKFEESDRTKRRGRGYDKKDA